MVTVCIQLYYALLFSLFSCLQCELDVSFHSQYCVYSTVEICPHCRYHRALRERERVGAMKREREGEREREREKGREGGRERERERGREEGREGERERG